MNILSLALANFRNFSSKKMVFDPKLTVIVGPNGSGKSNILEAIGLMSGVRLRRVDTDLDLVKFGKSEAKIEGKVGDTEKVHLTLNLQIDDPDYSSSESERNKPSYSSSDRSESRSSRFTRTINDRVYKPYVKKSYFIDEIRKRWVDFTNHMAVVEFSPSDLELISGSPSIRRHHMDSLLASLDRDYWRNLTAYNKVVVRRNKVLQRIMDGKSKKGELDFWDQRLLEHGKYLTEARQKFFEFVNFVNEVGSINNVIASPSPVILSEAKESHQVRINSAKQSREKIATSRSVDTNVTRNDKVKSPDYSWELKQSLLTPEKLLNNRDRDISAGVTLSGPHRDDFFFVFHGKNMEFFGSRGEQRMAVLALKLVELEYYANKRGSRPVLALDDIFSELDWEHRGAVLGVIDKQQTIITTAEEESIPKEVFKVAKIIRV